MRKLLFTWTAAAALAVAADPTARLSGPVLGYVFDAKAKAIRPLTGIPGAASLDAALPSASKLQIGFVSPNREWLLAILLEGGVQLVNLRSGSVTAVEGAPQDAALGAWSSDGKSIAVWGRSGVLQVWNGLPEAPAPGFSQAAETAAGITLADGGQSALVWNESGLFSATADGFSQIIGEPVAGAAYRHGSANWAAVTGTQLLGSGVEPRALTIDKPAAVAFCKDGVLVAGKGAVELVSDLGGSRTVECDCEATSLDRLAGIDVFRLTGLHAESLAIYDGSDTEPRILYIPSEGGRQ